MTKYEALMKALEKAGGQEQLAKICGVTQPAISKWVNSLKEVPIQYVLQVEAATGISKHDLQPTYYPRPLNHPEMVSDMDAGEYGNRNPFLGKGVAA